MVGMGVIENDIITFNIHEVDPSLLDVLADWSGGRDVRNSHNALELAKTYVLWYHAKIRRLPTSVKFTKVEDIPGLPKFRKKAVIVRLPKLRAFRKRYYYWVKHLDLPKGLPWVLITLTLSRDIPKQDAWANINKWTSDFLQRFRVHVLSKRGFFHYMAVVERHQDGYPHVHILASFPFVPVEKIYSWWRDGQKQLSAFQGVDVQFLGNDVERVKAYVVKYLVKDFPKLWYFHIDKQGNVTVRVSTLFLWYFRVRLLMMSRSISRLRAPVRSPVRSSSDNEYTVFVGYSDIKFLWSYYYQPYGIAFSEFWRGFYDTGGVEKDWTHWQSILTVRYAKIL
jgi:hypothetical protein